MPVEIKELLIKGVVDRSASDSNVDIIKTVQEQIESYNFSLTTAEKNEIIQECISEFKNLIDRKSNF
ncbi:MAG: hypothetical protein CBD72_02195 [Flavobacteriaceae bacterium TMED212]|nr:MAG: hypothetical protein CBD72_02195 [Flavobacteriaceae bacterium TMED212]|tara:strand:+ start:296 stop:496 length:201 start_codon:yes stop_codon:yes gene_type:complete